MISPSQAETRESVQNPQKKNIYLHVLAKFSWERRDFSSACTLYLKGENVGKLDGGGLGERSLALRGKSSAGRGMTHT